MREFFMSRHTPNVLLALSVCALVFSTAMTWAVFHAIDQAGMPTNWAFPVPSPSDAWNHLIVAESVWAGSVLCVIAALCLVSTPQNERKTAIAIVALQTVLLIAFTSVRNPVNPDQYLYAGLANLVIDGYNPYDPPLKSAPHISPQLRAYSVTWSIDEGAPDAAQRVLLRDRYGPAWTLGMAAILTPFRNATVEVQTHVVRLVAVIAAFASSILLWIALRGSGLRTASLAAFALGPPFITQTAVGGHNDVVALAFALATYIAARSGRMSIAGLAAALCLGTKLTFIPLLPVLLVYVVVRTKVPGALRLLAAFAATVVITGLPFGVVRAWTQPMLDAHRYNAPYVVGFVAAALRHVGVHLAMAPLQILYIAAFAACVLALCVSVVRRVRVPILEATVILLIFAAARFAPWYVLGVVPLLLVRAAWSLPLFWAIASASLVLELPSFIDTNERIPFVPFVELAVVLTIVAVGFRAVVAARAPQTATN